MARNNDVNRLLVTKGNQGLLAKGKKVHDLEPGQLGVFDFMSGISVDKTDAVKAENFFLAVGLDVNGDGQTDDIMKSAGSHIQTKNMAFYSHVPYHEGKNMLVELKDYEADCETVYGIKLELRNQEIYRTQGYNQFIIPFAIKTGCCNACDSNCPVLDQNEITIRLFKEIELNPNNLIKAYMLPADSTSIADALTVEQVEALIKENKEAPEGTALKKTKLVIEALQNSIHNFCSVNLNYFYPRQTFVTITKVEGFECNGKVEVLQEAVFEEGSGYDVKQLEYYTKGFTESTYRLHSVLGVAKHTEYNADAKEKYDLFALTYDQFSIGAWLEYMHKEATTIAIPKADATTIAALKEVLEAKGIQATV